MSRKAISFEVIFAFILCIGIPEFGTFTKAQSPTENDSATTGRIAFIDPKEPRGKLKVKQKGAAKLADASEGMEVRRGYLLVLDPEAKATIVCNDGKSHELIAGRQGCPCAEQAHGIMYDGSVIPGTRGPDTSNSRFPVAVSPRKTLLLNPRPTFRWIPAAGSDATVTYKVSVYKEPMKEVWARKDIAKTELPYPDKELPLTAGETYIVVISSSNSDAVEPQRDIGFTVMTASETKSVRDEEAKVQGLKIPDLQKRFILANLYATKALHAEAIEILEELSKTMKEAAVLRMLGDLYTAIGLNREAGKRYLDVLSLPQLASDPEGLALTLRALAHTYQSLGASNEAAIRFDAAIKAYEELGDSMTVEELKTLRQRAKKN
jgi:hypothetical protein